MTSMFERHKTREYKGHKEKVHTVAWNSDGRRIASGSVDKTARVWNPHRVTYISFLYFFFLFNKNYKMEIFKRKNGD